MIGRGTICLELGTPIDENQIKLKFVLADYSKEDTDSVQYDFEDFLDKITQKNISIK